MSEAASALGGDAAREAALRAGLGLSAEQASKALAAREPRESFGRMVRRLGLASDEDAARALAQVMQVKLLDRAGFEAPPAVLERLNPGFLDHVDAAIVGGDDSEIVIAVADPEIDWVLQGIFLASRKPVRAAAAPLGLIEKARSRTSGQLPGFSEAGEIEGVDDEASSLGAASREAPVVRLVDDLIAGAARARASDLHIESYPNRVRVRLRVDGVLHDWRVLPSRLARVVVSRVKILAGLDIAERRLPQDGRARTEVDGSRYDLRVATSPAAHGENVVIRFLVDNFTTVTLDTVGLSGDDLKRMRHALAYPYGLVLVVGPTGAGKSTTLAGALTELNRPGEKLISIEDPVEYQIDGVTQIAVKPQIGLTFASALRSILRTDPDVIVVGELRDRETAEMATDAALTGHRVLATLHANDAAGAIPRLNDLGVETSLMRSTLRLVIAQRLVRQLCPQCCKPDGGGGYEAVGCIECENTGYKGRTGIFELLTVDDEVIAHIKPGCSALEFAPFTRVGGVSGLRASAMAKVKAGVTSMAEVLRVLGP